MIDLEWKRIEMKNRFRRWLTDKMIEWDIHKAEMIKKKGDILIQLYFQEEDHPRRHCIGYVYGYEGEYCSVTTYSSKYEQNEYSFYRGEVACRVWDYPVEEFIERSFYEYEHIVGIYDDELQAEMMAQRI